MPTKRNSQPVLFEKQYAQKMPIQQTLAGVTSSQALFGAVGLIKN